MPCVPCVPNCCAPLSSRQVLDDSTDPVTRELVDESVADWRERGINVECLRRTNRQGYKAGAMKEVRRWGRGMGARPVSHTKAPAPATLPSATLPSALPPCHRFNPT